MLCGSRVRNIHSTSVRSKYWPMLGFKGNLRAVISSAGRVGEVNQSRKEKSHAILPLALLEAIRGVDSPHEDGWPEYHEELRVKRLGMSPTVAQQIDRYARLAKRDRRVDPAELEALFRLVGKRRDASLLLADAGRRAARYAARRTVAGLGVAVGRLPGVLGRTLGFKIAKGAALRVFGLDLHLVGTVEEVTLDVSGALSSGGPCGLYGSAVAELLRTFTDFDGAMMHTECIARGESMCRWRAAW